MFWEMGEARKGMAFLIFDYDAMTFCRQQACLALVRRNQKRAYLPSCRNHLQCPTLSEGLAASCPRTLCLPEDFLLTLKNFTYLGGYFSHLKMKDGPLRKEHEFPLSTDGINQLDRTTHRILMTLAYYIPHCTLTSSAILFP